MLPFIKPRNSSVAGLIVKTREPDENMSDDSEEDSSAGIDSCSQELIRAIHAKDVKAVSAALKDAMYILEDLEDESEESENTYDKQNQLASEE